MKGYSVRFLPLPTLPLLPVYLSIDFFHPLRTHASIHTRTHSLSAHSGEATQQTISCSPPRLRLPCSDGTEWAGKGWAACQLEEGMHA